MTTSEIVTVALAVYTVGCAGAAVYLLWWRNPGCCLPAAREHVWVCRHRRTWMQRHGRWHRVSRRRYIRAALRDLNRDIGDVCSGRKH